MNSYHRTLTMVLILVIAGLAGCGGSGNSTDMELGGINTGEVLDGLLARTDRTLGSVNSMASAQAALPQLQAINDDFDDLIYHIPKLSYQGRSDLSKKAKQAMPRIQDLARRINDSPGLSDVLGPAMDTMVEKLGLLL